MCFQLWDILCFQSSCNSQEFAQCGCYRVCRLVTSRIGTSHISHRRTMTTLFVLLCSPMLWNILSVLWHDCICTMWTSGCTSRHTGTLKFRIFSLVTPLTGVLWGHMTHGNVVLGLCIEIDCLSMFWVVTLDVVLLEQDRKIHLRVNSPKQTSWLSIVTVQTWPISGDLFLIGPVGFAKTNLAWYTKIYVPFRFGIPSKQNLKE